jgi:hypothetical protein
MSTKGSFSGWLELTRMNWRPPRCSTLKRSDSRAGLNSMLAVRNASGVASLAARPAASSGDTEVSSISARSGWPSAESTVSLPRPAAWAEDIRTIALATAAVSCFNADDFIGRR